MEHAKVLVLCFDGTGNYFTGTDSDTNILKLYRMLNKNDPEEVHYYQPGIGTYVTSSSLSDTTYYHKFRAALAKLTDAAIGSSLADHVMGGYRFLMKHFKKDAEVFLFGFSRGAYTARFLAQMVDEIGLLSTGNEEMCHFAWELFQQWERRTPEQKKQSIKTRETMNAFKQTFGQDCRITFLGCFDTVFSVPKFENAWMTRSKFPYTAKSKAKFIRHAVAIDERRAKFRQHLISEEKPPEPQKSQGFWNRMIGREGSDGLRAQDHAESESESRLVDGRMSNAPHPDSSKFVGAITNGRNGDYNSSASSTKNHRHGLKDDQDIVEVWFPGCHTDIGGGWGLDAGETALLSQVPLAWMVQEAQRAGLRLNEDMARKLGCLPPEPTAVEPEAEEDDGTRRDGIKDTVTSELSAAKGSSPLLLPDFASSLDDAAAHGRMHDALEYDRRVGILTSNNGFSLFSVLGWWIMEFLPFRRMDLRKDGSWKARRFPLPMGEVRDIPHNALIHKSAMTRMKAQRKYRPGNLIMGGGGRGMKRAPESAGMGEWQVCHQEGDIVGESAVRVIPGWVGDGKHYPERHQVCWHDKVWTCKRTHKSSESEAPHNAPHHWKMVR